MKTPQIWKKRNFLSNLLLPISWLYGAATYLRVHTKKSSKVSVPVICIGNLTAGGTGKTPVSVAIAGLLQQNGKNPFFLSRGYGGKLKNILVNPEKHSADLAGDEPLILTRQAPVVVDSNRVKGAELAIHNGADCLVMDDGFQNPGLYKDLSFLVFDGAYGAGNHRLIPAGPLRESLKQGFKRAHALIIIGEDKTNISAQTALPVFGADIEEIKPATNNKKVLAFAGIGHPQKFYDSLMRCGLTIFKVQNFPDHHFYTKTELQNLIQTAQKHDLDIYTTSKDYVKIPPELKKYFKVLEIKIKWKEPSKLKQFIFQNI